MLTKLRAARVDAFSAKFKIWRQFIHLKLAPLALWMSGNPDYVDVLNTVLTDGRTIHFIRIRIKQ
jgi:hypothetical protein